MGYFEANPTFLEPERDLVFGLYDLDMEAAAPHLEAAMRVFPALARDECSVNLGPLLINSYRVVLMAWQSGVGLG